MFRGSLHSGERTEQECGVDDNDDVFFDFFSSGYNSLEGQL